MRACFNIKWHFLGLLMLAVLAGCADSQPKKISGQPESSKTRNKEGKVSTSVRADFSAAMAAIKAEEYDKAIKLLNKVIAQMSSNQMSNNPASNSAISPVPYINLALVYKKTQNLALAEENLKQAIKIDPDHPVANNEYALLYRNTGRFAEAKQVYEKLLEKHPNFLLARKNLGILCDLYMKDYQCALKHYVIYSGARPDDETVKLWIADLKGK